MKTKLDPTSYATDNCCFETLWVFPSLSNVCVCVKQIDIEKKIAEIHKLHFSLNADNKQANTTCSVGYCSQLHIYTDSDTCHHINRLKLQTNAFFAVIFAPYCFIALWFTFTGHERIGIVTAERAILLFYDICTRPFPYMLVFHLFLSCVECKTLLCTV